MEKLFKQKPHATGALGQCGECEFYVERVRETAVQYLPARGEGPKNKGGIAMEVLKYTLLCAAGLWLLAFVVLTIIFLIINDGDTVVTVAVEEPVEEYFKRHPEECVLPVWKAVEPEPGEEIVQRMMEERRKNK